MSVNLRTQHETPSIFTNVEDRNPLSFHIFTIILVQFSFQHCRLCFSYFSTPALFFSFDIILSVALSSVSSFLLSMDNFP